MLALTRKKGQSIILGDNIEVTVVEIRGDSVRLSIKAPKEISIHRKEIYEEIQTENREAASPAINLEKLDQLSNIMKNNEISRNQE